MKKRNVLGLIIGGCLLSLAARAQCLSLADLTDVAANPTALSKPQSLPQLPAGQWVFRGTPPRSKEIQWSSAVATPDAPAATEFVLRPFLQSFDVVLKTTEDACVRAIRSELKALKINPVPVTCPSCEALRYDGPGYQATIYSKMKGNYPFVVVVHPLTAMPVSPPKAAGTDTVP